MADESFDSKTGQEYLKYLMKSIREEVNWEIEEERENLYWQLCRLINDRKSRLPNLREIFCKEEIDWLLMKCVKIGPTELIKFVIRTGYRDEPDLDEDGKPLLLRNTPINYAAEHKVPDWISKVRELFKIYDKFDVNYTNESGLTHFHVACMCGCDEIVEKFLELGQDPNISMKETGDTSLHMALKNRHAKTIELLLRNGGNPNLAKKGGSTCLHYIALPSEVDDDLAEKFFQIIDDIQLSLEVNAQDDYDRTPLYFAACHGKKKAIEWLLRKGADPNLASIGKWTALHAICEMTTDDDFMEIFFNICDDIHQSVQVDARCNSGRTPLCYALSQGKKKTAESLLRRGADPNLTDARKSTSLHFMAVSGSDYDLAEKFFEICSEIQRPVKVDAQEFTGQTPLHFAIKMRKTYMVECLLKNRANPNIADAWGLTSLHLIALYGIDNLVENFFEICNDMQLKLQVNAQENDGRTPLHMSTNKTKMVECLLRNGADPNSANLEGLTYLHYMARREIDDDLEWFFEICDNMQLKVEVDARTNLGLTPLHMTLTTGKPKMIEALLRRGADINLADNDGSISLHIIALHGIDNLVEKFFEICNDMQLKLQVNARENDGRTPLHMSINKTKMVECLLRNGADLNSANLEGLTYLHYMALREIDDDLEWFFEICDNMQLKVQVDARTNLGLTPLHMTLTTGKPKMIEALLRRGADINLADNDGSISLHIICIREYDDDLIKTFFKITDDLQQTVQVDAQDKRGRTPLQTAVANLLLNAVDVLLDRGADLSSFVFPSESYFCERFDVIKRNWDKLKLASGILTVLERLEDREYDLSRSDVLTIIKLFVKYELFEKSSDLEKSWYEEEEFKSRAREIIIIPNLSLSDLIQLRPEEAAKLLTYKNYFEIERVNNLDEVPEQYRDMCLRHLCEKMSRGYFKRLALDAFLELIHYRLPILCSDMVIENLKNEDLFKIYEAGEIVAKGNEAKTSDTVSKGNKVEKL